MVTEGGWQVTLAEMIVAGVPEDDAARLTGLFKNFNYAAPDSPDYESLLGQIDQLVESKRSVTT